MSTYHVPECDSISNSTTDRKTLICQQSTQIYLNWSICISMVIKFIGLPWPCDPWSHDLSKHVWTLNIEDDYLSSFQFLWLLRVCDAREFLDLKVFSQKLQGIEKPSKWFPSMWLFTCPSLSFFPHTLHRYIGILCAFLSEVFSSIELHLSSSSWKS